MSQEDWDSDLLGFGISLVGMLVCALGAGLGGLWV